MPRKSTILTGYVYYVPKKGWIKLDLNSVAAVFTIIGGTAGVIGAVIGGMALSKSSKANKTANEALNKITQNTIKGNNNTTINNQKVGKKSSVINGNNSSM